MHAAKGIVLKKYDAGEADGFFVIYASEYGKIKAHAQGVKKESARLKGHLEPLNFVALQCVQGRNGIRLTGAQALESWPSIRSDFKKSRAALLIAEFIDRTCMEREKDKKLWELLLNNFFLLERGLSILPACAGRPELQRMLAAFESCAFKTLGFGESKSSAEIPSIALLFEKGYNGKDALSTANIRDS